MLAVNVLAFLGYNLEVQPILGEKVACATVSPHLYILSYIHVPRYPPFRQLHSDFGISVMDFVMSLNDYIAESNPYMEFLTQPTFCFSPTSLA